MEVNYEGNNYSFPDDVSDTEVLEFFQGQSVEDSAVVTRAYQPSNDSSAMFQPTEPTAMQKPAEPEFLDRIDNPDKYPVIENKDGSVSTHRMSWAEVEGEYIAYPTIQMGTGGKLVEWKDTDEDQVKALNAALASNNYITFKSAEDADNYTKTYKRGTPMDDTSMYDEYLSQLSKVESGGRTDAQASTSSALGEFQFIDSTWLDLVKRKAAIETTGKTDEEILAMRTDKEFAKRMAFEFTRENEDVLVKNDIEVDPTSLYLAHFLGAGKAVEVLKADPTADITDYIGWSARMANRAVFGDMDTVEDLWRWAADKMGMKLPEQPVQQPVQEPQPTVIPKSVEAMTGVQPTKPVSTPSGSQSITNMLDSIQGGKLKTELDYSPEVVSVMREIAKNAITKRNSITISYADYPSTKNGARPEKLVSSATEREKEGGVIDIADSTDPVVQATFSIGGASLYVEDGDLYLYDVYDFTNIALDRIADKYGILRGLAGALSKSGVLDRYPSLIRLGSVEEVLGDNGNNLVKKAQMTPLTPKQLNYIKKYVESPQPEEEEVQVDGA